jgi:hypothetical protein
MAFAKGDTAKSKELKADYYPEDLIYWAMDNVGNLKKVEKKLEEVIKSKEIRQIPKLKIKDRFFVETLVREHY